MEKDSRTPRSGKGAPVPASAEAGTNGDKLRLPNTSNPYKNGRDMPRPPRLLDTSGGTYHICGRGNGRMTIFYEENDFLFFEKMILSLKKKIPFLLYNYCWMSNHIHMQLSPAPETHLPDLMQRINQSYTRYFNKKYDHVGHLWQGRYFSEVIDEDAYLLSCALYIERNPVDAGMVSSAQDYRWSSYRHYAFGEANPLVDENPAYLALGCNDEQRRQAYRALMTGVPASAEAGTGGDKEEQPF